MNRVLLKAQLVRHEGLRLKLYRDSTGHATIGVGRNLDTAGIRETEAAFMLDNDITDTEIAVAKQLPWYAALTDARQRVLVNMAFNLGVAGLLGFKEMLYACAMGDYATAAKKMLDSKWLSDVGDRARELAKQMEDG